MAVKEGSISAKVRVRLLVDVQVPDSWPGAATVHEVHSQATQKALSILSGAISADVRAKGAITVVGAPDVQYVSTAVQDT